MALLALLAGCGARPAGGLADDVLELPPELREVSGICVVDERTIACVQDEVGAVFFVDLRGERPLRRVPFGERGDWEAIARVDDDYCVLRSDGFLVRIAGHGDALRIVASAWLPAGFREWEALCYDAERRRLLAMPKHGVGDDGPARDRRVVFAVDPAGLAVHGEPVVTWSRRGIVQQAEVLGIDLPIRTTERGRIRADLALACTELLALPGGREFLLLAAGDSALLRIDAEGRLLGCRLLDRALLPQAEGMALLPDGRLLVASEGRGGPGRLVVVPLP